MTSDLEKYRAKRRFDRSPEPEGEGTAASSPIFVIQKHHARRMHYDLRLQIGQTLRSWAVPEGPCLDPKIRRFAKLVEDHPLDYARFEGRIPAGNYGAGTVIVWDRGSWVTLSDPDKALASGELKFRLSGEKLRGGWTLVRLPDDETNWLLIKERDIAARPLSEYDILKEEPNSVISGRPVDEPPAARKRVPSVKAATLSGARLCEMPRHWSPELTSEQKSPPPGTGWIHEIKYDGYRTLVHFDRGKVRLITRNGHDWTKRYGALAKAFEKLPCQSAILDGEVVVQDPRGITRLDLLEHALSQGETHSLTYFAFDLCFLDGFDLSKVALIDRKKALAGLIDPLIHANSPIQLSEHVAGGADDFFAHAIRMGLEGIVSKKADSHYVQRRSADWVKVKRAEVGDFTVIGFLASAPKCVTSLLLAEERDGKLAYACRAGSGISESKGRELFAEFSKIERATPIVPMPRLAGARFIDPHWMAQIGFRARSSEQTPRQPVFLGLQRAPQKPNAPLKPRLVSDQDLAGIHLTNPDREIFSGSGVTKLDISLYYARVGDWLLPELLRRPVSLFRCPTGDIGDCFYQRHSFAGLPDGIETVELADEEGRAAFISVTSAKGYLALTQFGAIEFHVWGCRIDDPEHPDRLVIDLDPDESLAWVRVCDAAEILRDRLEDLGLHPFLRTTGGKGLHLVMPLSPKHDWPTLKRFAEAFAKSMASDAPGIFTAVSSKERRRGKIYIDYLRNARGASAITSYSLRARPNFPAATPITWPELRGISGGSAFQRVNLLRRIESLAADPWDGLNSAAGTITPKMRREVGMKS